MHTLKKNTCFVLYTIHIYENNIGFYILSLANNKIDYISVDGGVDTRQDNNDIISNYLMAMRTCCVNVHTISHS